jgi:hypothetical protein
MDTLARSLEGAEDAAADDPGAAAEAAAEDADAAEAAAEADAEPDADADASADADADAGPDAEAEPGPDANAGDDDDDAPAEPGAAPSATATSLRLPDTHSAVMGRAAPSPDCVTNRCDLLSRLYTTSTEPHAYSTVVSSTYVTLPRRSLRSPNTWCSSIAPARRAPAARPAGAARRPAAHSPPSFHRARFLPARRPESPCQAARAPPPRRCRAAALCPSARRRPRDRDHDAFP